MKLFLTSLTILLSLIIQPVQADIKSDGEKIMNGAEQVLPQFFPSKQKTKSYPPYLYRFYPSTEIYVGINQKDGGVYVLGGVFGDEPLFVGPIDEIIAFLKVRGMKDDDDDDDDHAGNGKQRIICDTGDSSNIFSFEQYDDTTTISTGGQCPVLKNKNINACIPFPDVDSKGNPIATGIHALGNVDVKNFNINGFTFPKLQAVVDRASDQEVCFVNAPDALCDTKFESNICLDITNQVDDVPGTFSLVSNVIPGVSATKVDKLISRLIGNGDSISALIAKVRKIVPGNILSNSVSTTTFDQVDDCFVTDAGMVVDLLSREAWEKQGNKFVKISK
ncbi:MAG: hypothetical protein KAH20_14455 [Methylococcales bacterium]|nr:hypothetical protein [Methylococcales bacterium]